MVQEALEFGCQLPVYLVLQEIVRIIPGKIPPATLAHLGAHRPSMIEELVLRPLLGYPTLALPFFYRHHSLRTWLGFMVANLWLRNDSLSSSDGASSRTVNWRKLIHKFLEKLSSSTKI